MVTKFSYLGDVLRSAGGVQDVVTARMKIFTVTTAKFRWTNFKDIASVLYKRIMLLKMRGIL